jgi:diguanylate cyclase (GGDEF)-like protein
LSGTETEAEHATLVAPRVAPGRSSRPHFDTVVLSVLMIGASLAATFAIPDFAQPIRGGGDTWWAVALLAVAFGATELTVFRFQFRREAMAFSMSEVPMVLAVVYVAPGPALAARLVGYLCVVLATRRLPLYKILFNVALLTLELACTYLFVRLLVNGTGDSDAALVFAVVGGTLATSFVASVMVSIVISRFEGALLMRIRTEMRLAWWLFFVNATLAGMVLALSLVSPWLLLLSIGPLALLWYVIKAYGAIDQRLRDLDAVHGFTGRVGQSLEPDEIGRAAVLEAADILRSDSAALVVFDGESLVTRQQFGEIGIELPKRALDGQWARCADTDDVILLRGSDLDGIRLAGSDVREVMVAPIRDQSGVAGVMVVAGRPVGGKRFAADDLVRLRNLTEQLTTSLRKGMLHQRIEREARQDGLTGLPNRTSFERSLVDVAARHQGDGPVFVVMLDLDRFKEVNDTLGHQAGDQLLIEVGERMCRLLGPGDVLARLAGDEFAIVGHRRNPEEMLELAWACVREVGRPVTLDGLEIVVTASAGLAIVEDDFEEGAPLRFADIAMFNAKSQRLGVEVYRDEIDRRTPARLSMLGDLRAAIDNEQLHLHLQPKLDLTTGTVVGAEALVRWTHPVRGVVPPTQFVRIAEDTGLIKQLTDLMLHNGITNLRAIHDRGYHLGLSVNLSTHDLLDRRLAERVQQHLTSNDVDPSMLTLEITESSLLIDAPRARATINELHEIGVALSIDDFGTGYSSLSYLRRLPVGELKIDQSFVSNVLLDEQDEVIVRSTIDLGHNLGLVVVAEGVENNEVLERLRTLGCDIAQGYCISRPLAPRQFMSWLATTGHPSQKEDPLDFSRWIDAGPKGTQRAHDPALD